MSSISYTPNYHLPKFDPGSHPAWTADVGTAMSDIDTALYNQGTEIAQLKTTTGDQGATLEGLQTQLNNDVTNLQSNINAVDNKIPPINTRLTQAESAIDTNATNIAVLTDQVGKRCIFRGITVATNVVENITINANQVAAFNMPQNQDISGIYPDPIAGGNIYAINGQGEVTASGGLEGRVIVSNTPPYSLNNTNKTISFPSITAYNAASDQRVGSFQTSAYIIFVEQTDLVTAGRMAEEAFEPEYKTVILETIDGSASRKDMT